MNVESRDSVSLKPAELDEFGQLLNVAGLRITDADLDHQVEQFPLVVLVREEDGLQGVLLGSLERIGGTPSILWGTGVARRSKEGAATLRAMTNELARRAAISFPDEDVVVATRIHRPSAYTLLQTYANVVPRPGYNPNGEDRAWGRRLAKRFGFEGHFDDRTFRIAVKGRKPPCVPVLDASAIKATGGAKIVSLVGDVDVAARPGAGRLRLGSRRRARLRRLRRRPLTVLQRRVDLRTERLGGRHRLPAHVARTDVRGRFAVDQRPVGEQRRRRTAAGLGNQERGVRQEPMGDLGDERAGSGIAPAADDRDLEWLCERALHRRERMREGGRM